MSLLTIQKLTMRFGGITAVDTVDLAVEKGEIFSVIGPNGAGKTTVFNAITGIYEPTEGEVLFEDAPLVKPVSARPVVMSLAVGLLVAVLFSVLAVNVEALWQASIRDVEAQWQGRITLYRDAVTAVDRAAPLATIREQLDGEIKKQVAARAVGNLREFPFYFQVLVYFVAERAGDLEVQRWQPVVQKLDLERVFKGPKPLPTNEVKELLEDAMPFPWREALAGTRRHFAERSDWAWLGFVLGFLIGTAGMFVSWRRARQAPDVISQRVSRAFQNIRLFHP